MIELQDDTAVYALQHFVDIFELQYQVPRSSLLSNIADIVDEHYSVHPLSFSIVRGNYLYSTPRVARLADDLSHSLNFASTPNESYRTAGNISSDENYGYDDITHERPSSTTFSINDQSMVTEAPTTCSNVPVSDLYFS